MLTKSCLRLDPDVVQRLRALNLARNYRNGEERPWTQLARRAMELGLRELEKEMGVTK